MQRTDRDALVRRAVSLMNDGVCDRVLAWRRGEFSSDVSPGVFTDTESVEKELVRNFFCGANLSKYLISETEKTEKKVLIFLRPCDSYSFNRLLSEHKFNREKVYAVAVGCDGTADIGKLKRKCGALSDIKRRGDKIIAESLYETNEENEENEENEANGAERVFDLEDVLSERCLSCNLKNRADCDEIISDGGRDAVSERFFEVRRIENMSSEERYEFWRGEFSRCIRCNACRDVCPACTCEKCVFSNPSSGVENKAAANSFEESMFHIIRAFHVAGRCTDCGECSRVCPQSIPLHLLNRKLIKDINILYGEYKSGESVSQISPLNSWTENDADPSEVAELLERSRSK